MKEDKRAKERDDVCSHPLLCAEDWKDPPGAKVLGEYHKDGGDVDEALIEADLDAFERYWHRKQGINFSSQYHKEGAPYLEEPYGWEGHGPRPKASIKEANESKPAKIMTHEVGANEKRNYDIARVTNAQINIASESKAHDEKSLNDKGPVLEQKSKEEKRSKNIPLKDVLDLNTLEVLSYWMFRLAFGKHLHIPIRKEGLADLDIQVNNRDITINTNQLYFAFPELVVWHITYSHKGRPIIELGRGVKNGIKVHRLNALRLGLEIWLGARKSNLDKSVTDIKTNRDRLDLEDKGDIT
ncbi:MAG: hypothetical protein QW520_01640 [Methanomassiliicoccales archaeon]